MKQCSTCKIVKPLDSFHKNRFNKDGLQYRCKECIQGHYTKTKDAVIARVIEYSSTRKEIKREYDKMRRATKLEEIRAYDRARNKLPHRLEKSRNWTKNNPDAVREIKAKSRKKNWTETYHRLQATFKKSAANRRAYILKATPKFWGELDDFALSEAYELAKRRENVFGFAWDVDHVVPLKGKTICGLHYHTNWAVIPRTVNRQKHNKFDSPHFERKV